MTADFSRLRLLLVSIARWINRHQQDLIEYLLEENQFVARSAWQRSLVPLNRLAERDDSFVKEVRALGVAYMPRGQTNDRRCRRAAENASCRWLGSLAYRSQRLHVT